MVRKKRNPSMLAGVPSAAPPTSAVDHASASNDDDSDDQESKIGNPAEEKLDASSRYDWMQVFLDLDCGHSEKLDKLLEELRLQDPNSGVIYNILSTILMRFACDETHPKLRKKYLKGALEASGHAVSLSPSSVAFARFHAKVLLRVAKDDEGFEAAVRECHRGLNIERQVDPLDKLIKEGSDIREQSLQGRTDNERSCLQRLLENIQEVRSNPGKAFSDNFWNDVENRGMGSNDQFAGDTVEDKKMVDQINGSNQLHQDPYMLTKYEDMEFHPSSRLRKLEDKKKRARLKETLSSVGNIAETRSYWNTLGADEKQDLLKTRIDDIHQHLGSLKDKLPSTVFSEAVSYAINNKKWKYWKCCVCEKFFEDWDLSREHLWGMHLQEISPKLRSAIPQGIDEVRFEKFRNSHWKPIDAQKALKMMVVESRNSSRISEECNVDHTDAEIDEIENCAAKFDSDESTNVKESESSVIDSDDQEWPFSDDVERAWILDRIKTLFFQLHEHNFITVKLVDWILQIAIVELQPVIPMAIISKFSLHKTPLCICFLEASKLELVLKPLTNLAHSCNLSQCTEEDTSSDDEKYTAKDRVVFSEDFSSLVWDKSWRAIDLNNYPSDESVADDGCAVISGTNDHEHDVLSESGDFITLLLTGLSIEDYTSLWTQRLEYKKHRALLKFGKLRKAVENLQKLCEQNLHQMDRWKLLSKIGTMLNEEVGKSRFVLTSHESLLLKRQQELGKGDPSDLCTDESKHIDEILKGAQALDVPDHESRESEESRIHKHNLRLGSSFWKLDYQLSEETILVEARLRRTTVEVHKKELKLKLVTQHDYRGFISSILNFFSRTRLKDLVFKNATEKSEAAGEALLAELELDAKRSHAQEEVHKRKKAKKSKNKKKKKKNSSVAKASEELPETENHQSPVTKSIDSAVDIQGPPDCDLYGVNACGFDSDPMDRNEVGKCEEAGLETNLDNWMEDMNQDNQFKQTQMSELSEQTDDATADNLAADMELNEFEISRVFLVSQELPGTENHQSHVTQKVDSAVDMQGLPECDLDGESARGFDSDPMDTNKAGKCEEAGVETDLDNVLEDMSQVDNQFRRAQMCELSEQKDGATADILAAGMELNGLEISGVFAVSQELPETENHQSHVTQNVDSAVDIQSPPVNMNEVVKSEEAGVETDIDYGLEEMSQLDNPFKQTQMSELSVQTYSAAENLAAGMELNEFEISRDSPEVTEMNFDGNVSSSESDVPINDRNESRIEVKKDADPEPDMQCKPYEISFDILTCGIDFDTNNLPQVSLRNDVEDYNWFLKFIIQSLRHLRIFQDVFMKISSSHCHVGEPCIICSVSDIFIALSKEAEKKSGEAINPTARGFASDPMDTNVVGKCEHVVLETNLDNGLENMSQLDNQFKQAQMSELSEQTNGSSADKLAANIELNEFEISRDSSEATENNFNGNVISSSELDKPINDRNESQIEVKDADPEPDMPRKPYKISFGTLTFGVDFDTNKLSQVGLRNDAGDYNCFLNVIIQSLWHLRIFQDKFMSSFHCHVGKPCVICTMADVFTALSEAAKKKSGEAVDPTALREALTYFSPDRKFFQQGQMNDASEVLGSIFHCLHLSVTSAYDELIYREDTELSGSDDCKSSDCLSHTLFGMNISKKMKCEDCGLLSRCSKYWSFFYNLNANALRDMKVVHGRSSFSELVKLVVMRDKKLTCDQDLYGCGAENHFKRYISEPPHYFIIVLGWKSAAESSEDISATLATLSPHMDISLLYEDLKDGNKYCLVSLVCYVRRHCICFSYDRAIKRWGFYDDSTVKVVGNWSDVLIMCKKRHFQPQLLFFEAVDARNETFLL